MAYLCTDLIKPRVDCPQMVVVILGAALELVQLRLDRRLLPLVLAHLPQNGVLLESLVGRRISRCVRGARARRRVVIGECEPRCHLSTASQRLDANGHR
jgi:hypothetical protein